MIRFGYYMLFLFFSCEAFAIAGIKLMLPCDQSASKWHPERLEHFEAMLLERIIGRLVGYYVPTVDSSSADADKKLIAFESSLAYSGDRDIAWGLEISDLRKAAYQKLSQLEIHSVIGPKTRSFYLNNGVKCPESYGHPGMLFSCLFTDIHRLSKISRFEVLVSDEFQGLRRNKVNTVGFNQHWLVMIQQIISTKLLVTSSLTLAAIAESFGVPVRICQRNGCDFTKYEDYYEITNRKNVKIAQSVNLALKMRGVKNHAINIKESQENFINSFPYEYYKNY